jgi:hypothetical protein
MDDNTTDPILLAIKQRRDTLQGRPSNKEGITSESRSGRGLQQVNFGLTTVHDSGEGLAQVNKDIVKSQLQEKNDLSKKAKE